LQAKLNVVTQIVAFGDEQISNNPRLKYVDWLRTINTIGVSDPKSEGHQVPAYSSLLIFDGTRSTTIDGDYGF